MKAKHRKWRLVAITAVVVILTVGGYFGLSQLGNTEFLVNAAVMSKLPACDQTKLLATSPIATQQLPGIGPMGNLNAPGGHVFLSDHIGFAIKKSDSGAPVFGPGLTVATDILAPGDVHVFGIRKTDYHSSGQATYSDYGVAFANCKNRTFYFNHVGSLSPKLSSQLQQQKPHCQTQTDGNGNFVACEYHLDYSAASGEVIASVGGRPNTFGIDFGSFDQNMPALGFIHPKHLPVRNLYAQCPLNYFQPAVAQRLLEKFSNRQEPRCGEVMQDKLGTIQGNWYVKGKNESNWSAQLGVFHDTTDRQYGVVTVGGTVGSAREVGFLPTGSGVVNREPAEVKADGHIYCYQAAAVYEGQGDTSGSLILQLVDDRTMKVEIIHQGCSDTSAFSKPTTYLR